MQTDPRHFVPLTAARLWQPMDKESWPYFFMDTLEPVVLYGWGTPRPPGEKIPSYTIQKGQTVKIIKATPWTLRIAQACCPNSGYYSTIPMELATRIFCNHRGVL